MGSGGVGVAVLVLDFNPKTHGGVVGSRLCLETLGCRKEELVWI